MIRKLLFSAVVMMMVAAFTSCDSSHKDEAMKIFDKIPANAQMVAVINAEDIVAKGAKPEDMDKVPVEGVKTAALAVFVDDDRTFITGLLDNAAEFEKAVEKKSGEKFEAQGDIRLADHYAVSGDRFWYLSDGRISLENVKEFMDLSGKDAFSFNPYAATLADSDDDVAFLGNLNAILDVAGRKVAQMRLGINMIFQDPAWIAGSFDGENGKAEIDVEILNSEFKPSKFLFEASKIDRKALSMLKQGDVVVALALSDNMKKQLANLSSGFGGKDIKDLFDLLGGNIAMSVSPDADIASFAIEAGSPAKANQLQGMIENIVGNYAKISFRVDGDYLLGNHEASAGNLMPSTVDAFKDALLGVWVSGDMIRKESRTDGVADVAVMMRPADNSVKVYTTVNLVDKNKNFWVFASESSRK